MGDPRKLRKQWEKPKQLFDKSRIDRERKLVRTYGFKRKREIWKIEYLFKNYKRRARNILADYREEDKKILVNKLASLGILSKNSSLDDVLNLNLENFLDRRLQTVVHKKGLANTVKEVRQLITHKKVFVGERVIDQPNYIVSVEEEKKIKLKEKPKKEKSEEAKSSGEIKQETGKESEGEIGEAEQKEESKESGKEVKQEVQEKSGENQKEKDSEGGEKNE